MWAGLLGLLGLVWHQHRAAVQRLEERVKLLEQNHRDYATQTHVTELTQLIRAGHAEAREERDRLRDSMLMQTADLHRKLDATIASTHEQLMRLADRERS